MSRMFAIVPLALLAAACSGSTAPKTLSTADAQELFAALTTASATVGLDPVPAGRTAAAAISATSPCPAGGTVSATGSSTSTATSTTTTATTTYTGCQAAAPAHARVWTINGSLTIQATSTTAGDVSATLKGAVTASTSGASASCAVDVTVTATAGGTATATGSVCGQSVAGS